jgi:4-hydroxybenzoate polyprenyltransferase
VAALFRRPLETAIAIAKWPTQGRAAVKAELSRLGPISVETLPFRADLVEFLREEKRSGRCLHLATGSDGAIATRVADHLGLFDRVYASGGRLNLKGRAKGEALAAAFPQGFSYAGDSRADLSVWALAESGIVVARAGLARSVAGLTQVERHFGHQSETLGDWVKALRPHQWAKNLAILAPVALGWNQLTPAALWAVPAVIALFCVLSSLTYLVNDIADLSADRSHASKSRRPFASGAIPLRRGLIAAGLGIPITLFLAFLVSVPVGLCLCAYCAVTFAYSAVLKRAPIVDCMTIGGLFTLRLVAGVAAAQLGWSPWFLTFGSSFFCSLALAKRHAELVGPAVGASGTVLGRGYRYEDSRLTLALGTAMSTTSIIILILYLMEEAFPHGAYAQPGWLWAVPPLLFAWTGRVWLISNRGEMHDDPVVFALRDRASLCFAAAVAVAFVLAVL